MGVGGSTTHTVIKVRGLLYTALAFRLMATPSTYGSSRRSQSAAAGLAVGQVAGWQTESRRQPLRTKPFADKTVYLVGLAFFFVGRGIWWGRGE